MAKDRTTRGYTFACVCGRQARGQYTISVREHMLLGVRHFPDTKIDPKVAVCRRTRGKAAGQPRAGTDAHEVGCGRTLEESDAEREAARV